jgi:site-specific DNA recombinase
MPGYPVLRRPTRSATRTAAGTRGHWAPWRRSWPTPATPAAKCGTGSAPTNDLIDPANTGLGHCQVQRWNLPDGWVISTRPAHPALVTEADFIAVQEISTPRGPAGTATRRYLLAGLIRCGTCGRRLESSWSKGHPAYRCRHGYTSATRPDSTRARNSYIREDHILPHLAALAILLASHEHVPGRPGQAGQIASLAQAAALIDHLLSSGRTLTYDPQKRTLQADTEDAVTVAVG